MNLILWQYPKLGYEQITYTIISYRLNSYDASHNVRIFKGGGGIAVYVNSDFTCKFLTPQSIVVNELLESISV